jgi:dihydroflavonol-4-reductase
MRILVTGGTGFVGSHTVAAVIEAGHEVRLLVRSPDRVRPALDPLGVGDVDTVTGDVNDESSVRAAVDGCDALIHAGSMYSLDRRKAAELRHTNVVGTQNVLRAAEQAGLDPIVHVSSMAAFFDRGGVFTPDTEPGTPPGFYFRSKADSDRVARAFQARGVPVVITYPPMVWGPQDPHVGESCLTAINLLKGAYRFALAGGIVVSDVRDVARLNAAVLERGRGPRRYFVPSVFVEMREWFDRFNAITGRDIRTTMMPALLTLTLGRVFEVLQPIIPFRLPLDFQGTYFVSRFPYWEGWDDSLTTQEFGIARPDVDRTFTDTIRWLYEQGHVDARLVGRIAKGV